MSEQFYHDDTAYARDAMSGHVLDWSNQPGPYKYYKDLEPLPLPRPEFGGATLVQAAAGEVGQGPAVDVAGLTAILLMAAGVTQRSHVVGLRTWASAGALYPSELYFTACGIDGLDDGLYHFAPSAAGVHPLWPGAVGRPSGRDHRPTAAGAVFLYQRHALAQPVEIPLQGLPLQSAGQRAPAGQPGAGLRCPGSAGPDPT